MISQKRDEPLVWEGKTAWSSYIYIWIFSTVIAIRGLVSLWLGYWQSALFQGLVVVFMIALAAFFHETTYFKITREAVYRSRGFLGKQAQSFSLSSISSVTRQQGPLERFFDCGNVVMNLRDGKSARLSGIKNPDVVCRKIKALL